MDSSEDDNDDPAALDGLSLADAFKAFVLGAPDVQSSFEGTKAKFPKFEPTLKVILPLIPGRKWPLSFDAEVVARNLCAPKRKPRAGYKMGAPAPMTDDLPIEVQVAMTTVFARYNELTGLLRNGSVVAWGISEAGDNRKAIDPSYWDSTKLAIDITEGELGQVEAKNWRAKFEVIELHLPKALVIDASAEPKRKKPGPKKAWERQPKQYARLTKLLMDQAVAGELPDTKLDQHIVVEAGKLGITLSQTSAQRFLADSERMSLGKTLECLTNHGPS